MSVLPTLNRATRSSLGILGTHLRREVRDQRAILIGVFCALPVLTFLAFWAFADRLVEAPVDTAVGGVPPLALALFLLAVAGDVFAGEVRRGTLAFLRRTPGGLGAAFASKVLVTAAGAVLTVAWQALLLWIFWGMWGRSIQPGVGAVLAEALTSPLLLPVLAVGAFVLLASTWLQHGGMAVLLAPMLLGALVAPAVVWGRAHPMLADFLLGSSRGAALVCLVVGVPATALLAAALSFLRGRRLVRSAWSAVWRGLAVLLVAASGAYAWGAWRVDDLVDFAPGDEDVTIDSAFLGCDGRHLFLNALHDVDGDGRHGRYLSRCWVVDLETGRLRALGGAFDWIHRPPHAGGWGAPYGATVSYEPLSLYVQERCGPDGQVLDVWLDASTGDVLKVVEEGVRTIDIEAWIDRTASEATWTRDAEGRRAWIRDEIRKAPGEIYGRPLLCVEGEAPRPLGEPGTRLWHALPYPAGWVVRDYRQSRYLVVDATTGAAKEIPDSFLGTLLLSPRRCLRHGWDRETHTDLGWLLVDLDEAGTTRPAPGLDRRTCEVVALLDDDCVLTLDGAPRTPRRLCTWDPDTGRHTPVSWSGGALSDELREGMTYAGVLSHRSDGSALLHVGWGPADELGFPAFHALVTVERASRTATCLLRAGSYRPDVVAYEASGAVVVVEQGRRVVRWGPEPGRREVIFPRSPIASSR